MRNLYLILVTITLLAGCASQPTRQVSSELECNDQQFIYKVCTDQKTVLSDAVKLAKEQNQLLLITFGADWCPWCKSLHKIFNDANFVSQFPQKIRMVDIGMYIGNTRNINPSGGEALQQIIWISGETPNIKGYPFLAMANIKNRKVAFINSGDLEENTKTTYGHNHAKLKDALNAAIAKISD